ncbi:3,9-dihydroxypterocarpan 6A-monooxygenase [Benincasa hispida]|uniref:3,9-dihydroxypterocarpan 6A-monooxygenase n=1 Tax=Benincasa hispida TaxID=102211 RepID=UPI0019001988|nr:3,9-dihydroxypterocarpan 6A-monooxygenase [Benincasa hispida]
MNIECRKPKMIITQHTMKAITAIFDNTTSTSQFWCFWFIIAFLLHLFLKKHLPKPKPSSLGGPTPPPSPPALPLIGHLHLLTPVLVTSFQALARRYGPLIELRLGASKCVVVSNAAVAKEILKTHEHNFLSRPEFGASEYFIYRGSRFVMAQYGPYWRFMKKLTMTRLLSPPQLAVSTAIRSDEIAKLMERIEGNSRENKPIDMRLEFTTLTNNIISRMVLSTRCCGGKDEAQEIKDLAWRINMLAGKLSLGDILGPLKVFDFSGNGKKFVKTLKRFDELVEKIMKEHEAANNGDGDEERRRDLLDILLEIYKDPNAEMKITKNDIKSFLLDLFMAGTDTTATAILWAMGELLNRRESLQELRKEITSVIGNKKMVEESDLPNLPYLRAVVNETLRLHPSAPIIIRECLDDCNINGLLIKAKTRVLVNAYAVMKDPESWSDPDKFLPERFLKGSLDNIGTHRMEMKGQNFRYIPFGSGKRGCPGASLALLVFPCAIATMVQRFDWKTSGDGSGNIDLTPGSGFAAEMATPLFCYANPIHGSD